ncbi:MAG: hypothetical protein ACT4QG_09115 [Sporichthyaceae bacterium]
MTTPMPPERQSVSIVLLGAFNPRIFTPSWFVARNLLPAQVVEEGSIALINNDLSAFSTDWCRLEVIAERFLLASDNAPVDAALRDLAAGTFRVLEHTPVAAIGVNFSAHYRLPDEASWHRFGHRLAPKETVWDSILESAGTRSLLIEGLRTDGYAGHVRVKVEPSVVVGHGIFIEVNDEFRKDEAVPASSWVPDVLNGQWQAIADRSRTIKDHLLSVALEGRGSEA